MSLAAVKLEYPIKMFTMTLKEIQEITGAELHGSKADLNGSVSGVNTDSRTLKRGELFVALKGENFDAHDFILSAHDRGAAAYLIDHKIEQVKPALIVKDTKIAFGQIAQAWRNKFTYPVIAVTGSNGKTTVKEMLFSILSHQSKTLGTNGVLATKGNFNNDIGVPITLNRMKSSHDGAVIEMGANHQGEISYLTQMVNPDVAIITNAAAAHLEGFGSLDGVAKAKGEIFEGLNNQGTAIINYDDTYSTYWKKLAGKNKIISFGENSNADVSYTAHNKGNLITVTVKNKLQFELQLPLLGKHNIMNALAAVAAAVALGVDFNIIKLALESMKPVPGRLVSKKGVHGSLVIDDTYNANPASLAAAVEVMSSFSGIHHIVLGDMGELGEDAMALHKSAAQIIKQAGVKYLYTLGESSSATSDEFGQGAQHFLTHQDLVAALNKNIQPDDCVLVKGSRAMQMEKIVNAICAAALEPGER
ncbi:UDP-N-acetylmuramoyl-tripeptide--D-alanyl-D-alanine ligase [hydrothermal vent metagenome]|uniref:UDP-MurNAc-pentapeptide synthetase n=1 Tax=hydrothermal vent metagenome TaxID=652676 RepID=A0A3B0ZWN7_9ZZZZ